MDKTISKIKISSPNRLVYPHDNITKYDIAKYYSDIATHMLPYIKNRLLSVIRCHDGVSESCFYKKHPTTEKDMIHTYIDDDEEYFYITKKSQLIYQVQMGTVEFHIWGSTIKKLEHPNIMIFDLDPDETLPLKKLREAVKLLKDLLDELDIKSYLKTSGGKGYHIVIPFINSKDWESFSNFAQKISILLEQKHPQIFTSNIRKSSRKGRIFIDWLRNTRGATCVCPYSLRSRDGATISWPIAWSSLDSIAPNDITIKNYENYLNTDPWHDFFSTSQRLY